MTGSPLSTLPDEIRSAPRFVAIHEARERNAARARELQARHKRVSRGFILSTAAAAVFGGLVLYGLDTPAADLPESPRLKQYVADATVRTVLVVLQALALALAAYCGYILNALRHAEEQLECRMKAEQGRLDRAMAALEIGHAGGPTLFRAGADFFSAELIDGQLCYLARSVKTRRRSAETLAVIGAAIAAIGALAFGLNGLEGSAFLLFAALVGVVSPAFISALKSWREANGDQERARFHAATWDHLNTLRGERGAFDEAVSNNDLAAAKAFADRVLDVLRSDHEAFRKLREGAPPIAQQLP